MLTRGSLAIRWARTSAGRIGPQDELRAVRQTRANGYLADGIDRYRVRRQLCDGGAEHRVSERKDAVGLRVRTGEEAKRPATRGRQEHHHTGAVDQRAATRLESAVRVDDGRDLALVGGEDPSASVPQRPRERNSPVVVDRGAETETLKEVSCLH